MIETTRETLREHLRAIAASQNAIITIVFSDNTSEAFTPHPRKENEDIYATLRPPGPATEMGE